MIQAGNGNQEAIAINRSANNVESNLFFKTAGTNEWTLYQDNDGTSDLHLYAFGTGYIQKWNKTTGAITFNNAYTFPTTDGTNNQVLTTDGAGNLSWSTPSVANIKTLKQPDGLVGMTPITHALSSGNYTVPVGKNLYIMTAYIPSSAPSAVITVDGIVVIQGGINASGSMGGVNGYLAAPLIIPSGSVVSGLSGAAFNGYTVNATVTPVFVSTNYTVPAGFNFVLTSCHGITTFQNLTIDGYVVYTGWGNDNQSGGGNYQGLTEPLFIGAGSVVSYANKVINGYLISQ